MAAKAPKDSAECGGPPTIAAFATLAYWNDIAAVSVRSNRTLAIFGREECGSPARRLYRYPTDGSNGLLFYSSLKGEIVFGIVGDFGAHYNLHRHSRSPVCNRPRILRGL